MQALITERRDDDPAAIFEWASVHDFLGREAEAIPLYRRALVPCVSRPAGLRTETTGTAICVAHHLHHERLDRKPLRGE
ncbi:tetratricopeptide repeat protein [Cryobacterium lyxosi]|uniref:Tetratricopeptide repeat protein n=2 Tax=Cryobacterium TaxID=69578 RepID=A0A4R8ZJP4_9MICO|nr:tetratricopeptide repeat protein [Cryobacterium lyxosi]TFD28157.1 tetratricopeptide repeat protein [Cryobacterium lyxosi]